MELSYMAAVDLVAMTILTFALYYRRHRRRDLVTAYAVLNVGVFAVASVLGSVEIGLGVGMGLFGVLSIIRLRSTEISQYEVAYYFSALSIGLITGLNATTPLATGALVALILAVVALVDSPLLFPVSRQQEVRLDRAFTDEHQLECHLEQMLGGRITNFRVIAVDLVNDSTLVDVRWSSGGHAAHRSPKASHAEVTS